ncbi:MAG: hypothetical protein ACM3H7_01875 [Acidobacteriaceae bacterium]
MIKPSFLEQADQATILGHVFGAPLVAKGKTWMPLLELGACGILSWVAGCKHPEWSRRKRILAGTMNGMILFAFEWCHNLAHAAFARWIGKPVNAIRITWGTPILIYYDINDPSVTPRQHIIRAVGGPAFNALSIPIIWCARRLTRQGSMCRYVSSFGLGVNIFLSTVSLLPIPGIDGGPILKWTLVNHGESPDMADESVKKVNTVLGLGLTAAAGLAGKKGHKWIGTAMAAFAVTALAIGTGLLKEQK